MTTREKHPATEALPAAVLVPAVHPARAAAQAVLHPAPVQAARLQARAAHLQVHL